MMSKIPYRGHLNTIKLTFSKNVFYSLQVPLSSLHVECSVAIAMDSRRTVARGWAEDQEGDDVIVAALNDRRNSPLL
jgi:hypothetical protein